MGDASEMSMSVQSAWEDLVVENPNRPKLEACLLVVLALVVICIMGLILFVFVSIQPGDNIKSGYGYEKTERCGHNSCPSAAIRILGWVNWTSTPCAGAAEWVCGGRGSEASDNYIYYTAQEAGEDYAAEYFQELFDRTLGVNRGGPEDDPTMDVFPATEKGYVALKYFLAKCAKGFQKKEDISQELINVATNIIAKTTVGERPEGFSYLQAASVGKTTAQVGMLINTFNFYPFGEIEYVKDYNITYLEKGHVVHHRMTFTGDEYDFKDSKYQELYKAGFQEAATYIGWKLADIGLDVFKFEKALFEAVEKAEGGAGSRVITGELKHSVPSKYAPAKPDLLSLQDLLEAIGHPKDTPVAMYSPDQITSMYHQIAKDKQSMAANYAMFRLLLYLAPLFPRNVPELAKFYEFAARVHHRRNLPNLATYCPKMAERHFPHDMLKIIKLDAPWLESLAKNITRGTSLLNEGVTTTAGASAAKSTYPPKLFYHDTDGAGGVYKADPKNSENVLVVFMNAVERTSFFYPPSLPGTDNTDATTEHSSLLDLMYKGSTATRGVAQGDVLHWSGGVLSGKPYYHPIIDTIFFPLGAGMLPFYHNDDPDEPTGKSIPATAHPTFGLQYSKVLLERVLHYYQYKDTTFRKPIYPNDSVLPTIGLMPKHSKVLPVILSRVKCFQKNYKSKPLDLFLTKSAVYMAYVIWRRGKNHAQANADTQWRLAALPFMNEEALFFITAGQAICEVADPAFPQKQKKAFDRVNAALHCHLYGKTMHCHKTRPAWKEDCQSFFGNLRHTDEKLRAVVNPK